MGTGERVRVVAVADLGQERTGAAAVREQDQVHVGAGAVAVEIRGPGDRAFVHREVSVVVDLVADLRGRPRDRGPQHPRNERDHPRTHVHG